MKTILALSALLVALPLVRGAAPSPPNVLIVMSDQLNAAVLGCYGGPVPTPHLDRIAREGVRFDNAVCTWPACSPSRASLVTSLYPHAHRIVWNVMRRDYPMVPVPATEEGLKASDVTTEKLLHAAGWSTHHYGKWHLLDEDLPYYPDMYGEHREYAAEMAPVFAKVRERDRDSWMNWYDWALPTERSAAFRRAVAAWDGHWEVEPSFVEFVTKLGRLELPLAGDFDGRVADKTVQRIKASGDRPFMITCSFIAPHDPCVVASPYYEMFDPARLELPANRGVIEDRFRGEWSRRIVADLGEPGLREFLRVYYARVKLVDDQVGRLLAALAATG